MERSDNNKILKAAEHKKILKAASRVESAEQTARQILDDAIQTRQKAYRTGYEKGLMQAKLENLEQNVKLVSESIHYINNLENEVSDLVISSVRKILDTYEPDELAFQSVKLSLKELARRKQITLRSAPGLTRVLLQRVPELDTEGGFVNILADERLEGNQCVIESELGIIHVDVEDKISELEYAFKSQINYRSNNPEGSTE